MNETQQINFTMQVVDLALLLIRFEQRAKIIRAYIDAAGGSDILNEAFFASNPELAHLTKAEIQNALFTFETIVTTLAAGHLNNLLATQIAAPI